MCLHPIQIKNPNQGLKVPAGDPRAFSDLTSAYINVPCGHCPQCIAVKQMYYVQRVQMESFTHHLFFATLTYNEESLPRMSVSTGYDIPYADVRDVQNMMKRLRASDAFGRPFSYFAVSERGSVYGRPHFHILFGIQKQQDDTFLDILNLEHIMFRAVLSEWKRNVAPPVLTKKGTYRQNSRSPVYRPLCDFHRKFVRGKLSATYDLHYITPSDFDSGLASVAFYVLKYMLKPSRKETRLQQALHLNLPEDEYESVWPIIRSKNFKSLGYGSSLFALQHVKDSVRKGIESGLNYPYPVFFNPESGQSFPLAPFYRKNGLYYSYQDALSVYYQSHSEEVDTVVDVDRLDPSQIRKKLKDYERVLRVTEPDRLDILNSQL